MLKLVVRFHPALQEIPRRPFFPEWAQQSRAVVFARSRCRTTMSQNSLVRYPFTLRWWPSAEAPSGLAPFDPPVMVY